MDISGQACNKNDPTDFPNTAASQKLNGTEFCKKERTGTMKTVFMGDESTGVWDYFDGDKTLDNT